MLIKHISFDLDGTLIDSEPLMRYSWERACRDLNITCDFECYKGYIGLPFKKIIENLELSKIYSELSKLYFAYNSENINLIKLNPSVHELIDFLKMSGIGFSLITSKPRKNTMEIIDYFKLPFEFFICADDVSRGKPHSDSFKLLFNEFGLKNDEVIYVGDSLSDLSFSINSGVKYIHYSGGIDKKLDDFLVADFIEISNLIDLIKILLHHSQRSGKIFPDKGKNGNQY